MSDVPTTPEWWQASDGKWYPPELHPSRQPPVAPPPVAPPVFSPPPVPSVPPVSPPSFEAPPFRQPPETWAVADAAPPPTGGGDSWWSAQRVLAVGAVLSVLVIGVAAFALLSGGDDDDDRTAAGDTAGAESSDEDAGSADADADSATADADGPTADDPADTAADADPADPPEDTADGEEAGTGKPTPEPADTGDAVAAGTDECRFVEVDDFGDIQIQLDFVGPGTAPADLEVNYVLRDGDVRIADGTAYVTRVDPGERVRVDHDTLTDAPTGGTTAVGCEITGVTESLFESLATPPTDADTCAYLGLDSFGDMQVEISVTNPAGAASDLLIDFVLRDGNTRVYSSQAYVEQASPSEQIRIDQDTFTEPPADVDADSLTCAVIAISAL